MIDTITLAHIYGLSNGLFLSAFIFMVFFGLSYVVMVKNRYIGKLFLFYSVAFLGLFFFSMLFQYSQDTVASQAMPNWLIYIAKFSVPVALLVFSRAFIQLSVMHSSAAFKAYQDKRYLLYALNAMNVIIFMALFFINDLNTIILLSLFTIMPYILLVVWYFQATLKNMLGRIFIAFFSAVFLILIYLSYLILTNSFQSLGFYVLPISIFLSVFIMAVSFSSIRFTYFDALKYHEVQSIDHKNVVNDINKAAREDEFYMVYQPKVSPQTGDVLGVEALIRWQHPVHGLVPPNEFVPVSEKTGMINEICRWTIKAVLQQQQKWLAQGICFPVSVNLSVANLTMEMAEYILAMLDEYQVPKHLLCLEITESLFLDFNDDVKKMLHHLQEQGIEFSIDDYGAGFSSLSYLKKLSPSELKIDRSFIQDIDTNSDNLIIVKSIFYMCQGLGLKIVAEGVENEMVASMLKDLNCDSLQGYGIAKPMKADALENWLSEREKALITSINASVVI